MLKVYFSFFIFKSYSQSIMKIISLRCFFDQNIFHQKNFFHFMARHSTDFIKKSYYSLHHWPSVLYSALKNEIIQCILGDKIP